MNAMLALASIAFMVIPTVGLPLLITET